MLSERQKLILNAIIDDYIRSAEPVGSRSISKREDVAFSPATIRNDMSDLEDLGYLEQPHTSAGRIPSQKGYRYYVDHLLKTFEVSSMELDLMKLMVVEKIQEMEKVVQQASSILSQLTNYTSIVLGPEVFSNKLRHLQLVPLADGKAVVIIVTNTGHVENKTVTIPKDIPIQELERFLNILNLKLSGVPLVQLKHKLYTEIAAELRKHVGHYEELIGMMEHVLEQDEGSRVYLSGTTHMLAQPEFRDVDKVKSLFEVLEQHQILAQLFASVSEGIQVRIGAENGVEAINNCSLITATYSVSGRPVGTIGILGPTRMEYGKIIHVLDHFSKDLAAILSRWYRQ